MFSSRIRYLRQSAGLTQVQLAEKLGVKKQSISNWENDNIMPSVEMLVRVADYFHVGTDYLLGRSAQDEAVSRAIDAAGLTPRQLEHIQTLVNDLRDGNRKT